MREEHENLIGWLGLFATLVFSVISSDNTETTFFTLCVLVVLFCYGIVLERKYTRLIKELNENTEKCFDEQIKWNRVKLCLTVCVFVYVFATQYIIISSSIVELYDNLISHKGREKSVSSYEELFSKCNVGDEVMFGSYEQDNDTSNGTEPVEWIVREKLNDRIFLISKYGLDVQQYNDDWKYDTWENSSLRAWLNNTFFNDIFNAEEQEYIMLVENENPHNSEFGTTGGNNTFDKVFILSYLEAEKYFRGNSEQPVLNTAYVNEKVKNKNNEEIYYWLRSGGTNECEDAAVVTAEGKIDLDGKCVDKYQIVRPAIWVGEP